MKWPYARLWALLATAFAVIMLLSTFDDLRIFGHQMAKVKTSPEVSSQAVRSVAVSEKNVAATDTCKYTLLFVGDSMLEGLSPRLAAYAEENGHSLYTVIWYGSTTEKWGATHKLRAYIEKFKPDYIVVCLGGNELFLRNVERSRAAMVDSIIADIGGLPFVWIGPPNWKPDTGINRLIAGKVGNGHFFLSSNLSLDRASDGAHPTREAAAVWMDSVAVWISTKSVCPMRLDVPHKRSAKPEKTIVLTPDD